VSICLPPLRERKTDIPLLLDHLIERCSRELGLGVKTISAQARQMLLEYDWPGNIRELENAICQAMILCEGETLTVRDLPPRIRGQAQTEAPLSVNELDRRTLADVVREASERLERQLILSRLTEFRGNRTLAAESLGISRKTLFNKMRQYGMTGEVDEEEARG